MANVYEKLRIIQQKLNAPKNQRNNFGNYNYRSCEDILQAVKPLLDETGTVLTLTDSMEEVGSRIYVHAKAQLSDVTNGESVMSEAYAREEEVKKGMDASQITGASSSYARKYALNGLFAIDDNKDSDATNEHQKASVKKTSQTPAAQSPEPDGLRPIGDDLPFAMSDPSPEPASPAFVCDHCGKKLVPYTGKDGKKVSLRAHAERSKQMFAGKIWCIDCINGYLGKDS